MGISLSLSNFLYRFHCAIAMASKKITKKRKFVADGVFTSELNQFLERELCEDGYAGVEVRVTPTRTEVIISATRTKNVLGEKGQRIRELTSPVQKRFRFPPNTVELFAEREPNRCATNCSVAWPCAAPATVSFASSWRLAPKAPRSSSPANCAVSEPKA